MQELIPRVQEVSNREALLLKSRSLKEAGMVTQAREIECLANNYIAIKETNIVEYVKKQAALKWSNQYDDGGIYFISPNEMKERGLGNDCIAHKFSIHRGYGLTVWTETLIKDYKGIPPANVVSKIIEVNKSAAFDYLTIATMEFNQIPKEDPLLLGHINDSSLRFFIAQWDNDILLDDLI